MASKGSYSERPSKEQVTGHHTPTPNASAKTEQAHELSLKHPSQMSHMKDC